jgi:hypothetical protein
MAHTNTMIIIHTNVGMSKGSVLFFIGVFINWLVDYSKKLSINSLSDYGSNQLL